MTVTLDYINIYTMNYEKCGKRMYRMRIWIEVETMIMIPDNRLNNKGERAEMTLMDHGSNQLHRKSGH